ncbi:selenide, water dikinase [Campylobacter sp. 19-13652]|nr:selenide, water dikinase [Campylobacter sp. 19-13652]
MSHPKILTGTKNSEDASVFAIDDKLAIVQTLDYITPVVDDPYIYGQIAAANALSDCFAMGANAITALNILGFDECHFDSEIANEIMAGGASKIRECGAALVGGHSTSSPEMFYGLSVTGIAKNGKFWANNTAKIDDVLILTKPLGFGVLATAIKAGLAKNVQIKEASRLMSQLNYYALAALSEINVNACTDVTGFGLLGHLYEMTRDEISVELSLKDIPLLLSAQEFSAMGLIPEGSYKNREFVSEFVSGEADMLLYDAQTSGGLLIAVSQKDANIALKKLKEAGYEHSAIIAHITKSYSKEKIRVV